MLSDDDPALARLLGARTSGRRPCWPAVSLLYATNEFLTISLLPSAVRQIGGERYYAWVTTVYLVASVVAATTVNALVVRLGPRTAYLWSLGVFSIGSVGCALAPNMELLLAGRVVQGAAGGAARRTWLCGDQFGSAAIVVDQGVGPGVGDVGSGYGAGTGRRRDFRPDRFVALGFRCFGHLDRGGGGAGALESAGKVIGV